MTPTAPDVGRLMERLKRWCECGAFRCIPCEAADALATLHAREREVMTGSAEPAGDAASADGAESTAALTNVVPLVDVLRQQAETSAWIRKIESERDEAQQKERIAYAMYEKGHQRAEQAEADAASLRTQNNALAYDKTCLQEEVEALRQAQARLTPCHKGYPHYCPNCDNSFAVGGSVDPLPVSKET